MPTLYEYHYGGTANLAVSAVDERFAQSFIASVDHTLTSIKWQAYSVGTIGGTLTFSLYLTDGSKIPTGSSLSSGTFDATQLPIGTADWISVSMSSVTINNGTQYAQVAQNGGTTFYLRYDANGTYSNGGYAYSADAGSTWETAGGEDWDAAFEEWGNPLGVVFIPKVFVM